MKVSKKLITLQQLADYVELTTDAASFRLYAMTDTMIRVRCSFQQQFAAEASYSLVMTAWEDDMDHVVKERQRIAPLTIRLEDRGDFLSWTSGSVVLIIYKEPFVIEITDLQGNVLHQDIANRSYVEDDSKRIYHYSHLKDDDYYYGFGEKSGLLNKKNRRMRMHNVDTIGYDSQHTDPLYKHIPFYIKFNGNAGLATGMFYHNTHDSIFDVGCERSGYWPKYSYFSADGGELDYFFMYGPTIKEVVRQYTDLTGKSMLMPKYSLGYLGSTMFYTELEQNSDQAIIGFLEKCKELGIPCDGFFMSSGYTTGEDGKRYVFEWNNKRFPDPAQFAAAAKEKGAVLSPNIKPGMLLTHPLYKQFAGRELYVKDEHGQAPALERYWGGTASFVDFTNPAGREMWKHYVKERLLQQGITSIWNDNNEYEIQQSGSLCSFEGAGKPISALSSVMPNLMAMTAVEAIAEHDPALRPYVTNRAGYAGIQRYAQTWAGDNYTSWNSLKYNIPLILGMGLSGVANQGCDIGGFFGPAPEPELFVRWVQNGIFQPRFSIHSSNTDNTVTEPWMYPSYTHYVRDAIQLRYRLIPYFYSLLYEASATGAPIMRPLVYEFPDDRQVWEESFQFMVGASLLVANIVDPEVIKHSVYLPAGAQWVEWHTKKRYDGGQHIELDVTLDSIPMFIRSGGIVPLAEGLMNVQQDVINKLLVLIEGSVNSEFLYYDDDGKSNHYQAGQYCKTAIKVEAGESTVIAFHSEGSFEAAIEECELQLICRENSPVKVELNGLLIARFLDERQWESSEQGWYYNIEQKVAHIRYRKPTENYAVRVDFTVKDLISI